MAGTTAGNENMTTWRDQVALVTGGARGIGRATARLLAQRGAAVCVNYVAHADAAEGLAAEIIAARGHAIAATADVGEAATVEMMVARAEKELGSVTILVNNAGMSWRGTLIRSLDTPFTQFASLRANGDQAAFIAGAPSHPASVVVFDLGSGLTGRLLAFSRRQALDPKPMDVNKFLSGATDFLVLRARLGNSLASSHRLTTRGDFAKLRVSRLPAGQPALACSRRLSCVLACRRSSRFKNGFKTCNPHNLCVYPISSSSPRMGTASRVRTCAGKRQQAVCHLRS